jgi:hypothetical protein
MKLNESHILDYLDNQLDERECSHLEAALKRNQEKSSSVDDARLAMQALHSLAGEAPVAVSEDFWPRLREKLPPQPSRNALWQVTSLASRWLWPTSSKWAISARVAVVVIIVAMASLWLGPQRTVTPISASEKAFISRSMQRHEDYVNTPPTINSLPLPTGDAASADHSADSSDDVYIP